jgi:uncharacterized membrane protein
MEGPAYALSMASYAKIDNKKTYLLSTVSYIIALPIVMIVAIATASTYGPTRLGFWEDAQLNRIPVSIGVYKCFQKLLN